MVTTSELLVPAGAALIGVLAGQGGGFLTARWRWVAEQREADRTLLRDTYLRLLMAARDFRVATVTFRDETDPDRRRELKDEAAKQARAAIELTAMTALIVPQNKRAALAKTLDEASADPDLMASMSMEKTSAMENAILSEALVQLGVAGSRRWWQWWR